MFVTSLGLVACSNNDDDLNTTPDLPNKLVISAKTDGNITRTSLNNDLEVLWSEGDKIIIDDHEFVLTKGAGTSNGEFTGDMLPDGTYDAYYAITGNEFPIYQAYESGKISNVPMVAKVNISGGKATSSVFKNLCGILCLTIKNSLSVSVKNITISADEPMAGEFRIANDAAVIDEYSKDQTIMLDCGNTGVALIPGGKQFYIAMPANEYSNLSIVLGATDGSVCTKSLKGDNKLVIEAGSITDAGFTVAFSPREYVDLGLPSGTKWATCNVGANHPKEYGNYFAWGETTGYFEGKRDFSENAYKWYDGRHYTKYIFYESSVKNDYISDLQPSDDAASVNWGGKWKMPTRQQWDELYKNCTITWESYGSSVKSSNGCRFTSNINGNSIFLPAAGYRWNSSLYFLNTFGDYMSTCVHSGHPYNAYGPSFWHNDSGLSYVAEKEQSRTEGHPVRPVFK